MNSNFNGYAVFFFPQALEALGKAIEPFLQDSPAGPHVLCREIDTGGSLIELSMDGKSPDGEPLDLELMLPTSMVRMIVSARGDQAFGFGPRTAVAPVAAEAPVIDDASGPALVAGPQTASTTPRRGQPSPAGRAAGKASDARKRQPAPAKRPPAKDAAKKAAAKATKKAPGKTATRTAVRKPGAKPARRKR